jgi:hypothetical protein
MSPVCIAHAGLFASVIIDDREADHRPRVTGRTSAAKPMDSLNPGGRRSRFGGDSL